MHRAREHISWAPTRIAWRRRNRCFAVHCVCATRYGSPLHLPWRVATSRDASHRHACNPRGRGNAAAEWKQGRADYQPHARGHRQRNLGSVGFSAGHAPGMDSPVPSLSMHRHFGLTLGVARAGRAASSGFRCSASRSYRECGKQSSFCVYRPVLTKHSSFPETAFTGHTITFPQRLAIQKVPASAPRVKSGKHPSGLSTNGNHRAHRQPCQRTAR